MGKVNKSVQKRIEVNKKNKERWRDKIKVQVEEVQVKEAQSKEEQVKKEEVITTNDYMKEKEEPKIKIEVKCYGKGYRKSQRYQSHSQKRKKYSLLTERVFETRRAQEADQKRKEELWEAADKILEKQEGFDR